MTCREAIAIVAEYCDLALAPGELARLEAHVARCAACQAFLATYRATRRLAAAAGRVDMPEDVRRRVRDFVRRALAATA